MTITHTGGYISATMNRNAKAAIAWMIETGNKCCKVNRMTFEHTMTSGNLWTLRVSYMQSEWSGLKERVRFYPFKVEE